MKKLLAMVLGAMLVAGSIQAYAASQIDFSGFYRAYFFNDYNYTRSNLGNNHDYSKQNDADTYFVNRLELNVTFTPTDEIQVVWRMRGPSMQRWGTWEYSDIENGNGPTLHTRYVYGKITQDWGTIKVGRVNSPEYQGLNSLGYLPSSVDAGWTQLAPFDGANDLDGVFYTNEWDNGFGLYAYYAKAQSAQGDPYFHNDADMDRDRIAVEPRIKWEGGGAALGMIFERDNTHSLDYSYGYGNTGSMAVDNPGVPFDPFQDPFVPGIPPTRTWAGTDAGNGYAWYLNPAIMHGWDVGGGQLSLHAEGKFGWGKANAGYRLRKGGDENNLNDWHNPKSDTSGYAFYLDGDYNYGPGHVTLGGWWVSGTKLGEASDNNNDPKIESLVGMGGDFYPLVVAFNSSSNGWGRWTNNAVNQANDGAYFIARSELDGGVPIFNAPAADAARTASLMPFSRKTGSGSYRFIASDYNNLYADNSSNHWAVIIWGDHSFTDEIAMHYAVAYMGLNDANWRAPSYFHYNAAEANSGHWSYETQDKELGWEIDLGFSFQLLDNLAFTTSFGYMFNGDAYKNLRGYEFLGNAETGAGDWRAVWNKADDTYSWNNTLTFSF